jgi:hypothetical protein
LPNVPSAGISQSDVRFQGEKIEIAEIAKRLNVAHVLEERANLGPKVAHNNAAGSRQRQQQLATLALLGGLPIVLVLTW